MDDVLLPFLEKSLKSRDFQVMALAGDASNRRYYRVVQGQSSWVLMHWEPYDPEKYPFLSVQRHFARSSVHVPEVVAVGADQGMLLLEDLGDLTLERKFWESQTPDTSIDFYKSAIDELIKIHFESTKDKSPCTAFQIQFDTEKLLWEMNYGKDNLLAGICRFAFSDAAQKEITADFTKICETLHQEPKWIAHRDYHSRNLMIKLGELKVIDFQDARLGPVQYDLVSLLRDSYVQIPTAMEKVLLADYIEKAKENLPSSFSRNHFDEIYELQTIQRCFKACGSFASFYQARQDKRYLKYISHTLQRVIKSLNEVGQFKAFTRVLIDSGALERKYELL